MPMDFLQHVQPPASIKKVKHEKAGRAVRLVKGHDIYGALRKLYPVPDGREVADGQVEHFPGRVDTNEGPGRLRFAQRQQLHASTGTSDEYARFLPSLLAEQ